MKRRNPEGIDADTLKALLQNGANSNMLRARLAFVDAEQFRKMLAPISQASSVHPSMMPTQTSGRWSTTDPPLPNLPTPEKARKKGLPPVSEVFVPYPGYYWLGFDWDGIEARHVAVLSGDQADLDAFANGWDIHTLTACDTFSMTKPPSFLQYDIMDGLNCEDWRHMISWGGKEDLRRRLAKNCRYGLAYGGDPTDPYNIHRAAIAILQQPGLDELGLPEKELVSAAVKYLQAKRHTLVEWKARRWRSCLETRVARTALGRRRMLFGSPESMGREGLNHEIQGLVADMMNWVINQIVGRNVGLFWKVAWLVVNKHDGARFSFPEDIPVEEAYAACKPIVEREWEFEGHKMFYSASWEVVREDGSKEKVKS